MKPFRLASRQHAVAIRADEDVGTCLPGLPTLELYGEPIMLVPHQPRETVVLRSLGYDVPAPILTGYGFPCPQGELPFEAQKQTAAMLSLSARSYVLNELGTGKTRAALWAWDYLSTLGLVGRLMVLAPLSTLKFTWGREVIATLPHRKAVVVHGTRLQRLERLQDPEADIYIINHDGLKTVLQEITCRTDITCLVVDELAIYRNNTNRSKALRKLANLPGRFSHVWGMTGAPIPNAPTDVWGQAMIVTPNRVPKYFNRLRDEMMLRVNEFKWVPKPNARERAFSILQPAVRYTLDDVVELPELIERYVDIEQSPEQDKIYKELVRFCYAALQEGEVSAANAGAAMSKLLQISCGYVYTRDKGVAKIPNTRRIEALIDAIEDTNWKVLVFAGFKHAITGISETLAAAKIEHACMTGDTAANARGDIFHAFQNTQKFKVLVAHPQCLSHGVTLTAANTIAWFGPITSLETYDQANARISRVGQKHKQLILKFRGTPVERHVYNLLAGKRGVQAGLLELFRDATGFTQST